MRFALLLPGALLVACSSTGPDVEPPPCPAGWSYDAYSDGSCHASDEVVQRNRSELTTGITGFVRLTTGTCDLCEHCTCNSRLIGSHEVQAFVASDVDENARGFCSRDGLPELPLARTTTDSDGIYSFKLAAGDYLVVSDDPDTEWSSPCTMRRKVTVADEVTIAPLVFDHGIY